MDTITSRRQHRSITCGAEGAERHYTLAPLTLFERNLFQADMTAAGFPMIGAMRLRDALREALAELAPANLPELLVVLDEVEALEKASWELPPDERAAFALPVELNNQRETIIRAAFEVPHYARLRAADQLYWSMMPVIILRRALRGWEGPGLPVFAAKRGVVADALIAQLPDEDVPRLGQEAWAMAWLPAAAGNASGVPSPANDSPAPSVAE